jgi:hypothetical protein
VKTYMQYHKAGNMAFLFARSFCPLLRLLWRRGGQEQSRLAGKFSTSLTGGDPVVLGSTERRFPCRMPANNPRFLGMRYIFGSSPSPRESGTVPTVGFSDPVGIAD